MSSLYYSIFIRSAKNRLSMSGFDRYHLSVKYSKDRVSFLWSLKEIWAPGDDLLPANKIGFFSLLMLKRVFKRLCLGT